MKEFFQPPGMWDPLRPHRLRSMLIFDPDKQIRSIKGIKVYLHCDLMFNEILQQHCKKVVGYYVYSLFVDNFIVGHCPILVTRCNHFKTS